MKVNVLHPPKYKPDFADRNKASQQAQRDKAPDLEVVYIGAVSDYSVQEIREKYVWSPAMGPIPVDGRSAGAVFYAGMHQGHQLGYLGIREDHTRDKTSLLYQNSIGAAANPKNMLQIMYRMCDSRDTKELVEAFIMVCGYCRKLNFASLGSISYVCVFIICSVININRTTSMGFKSISSPKFEV